MPSAPDPAPSRTNQVAFVDLFLPKLVTMEVCQRW